MFSQLIESRSSRRRSPAGFAASLALHGIIVAGAIITTSRTARPREPHDTQVLPIYREPVSEPRSAASEPRPPQVPTPLEIVPNLVSVSLNVPGFVPSINPLRVLVDTGQPMEFRIGTPAHPGTPDPGTLGTVGVLLVAQVDVPVVLDTRSPLPRFPQMLKNAGVEGMARLSFVVDTLGRVEPGTVSVLESTHPAFAIAVEVNLPRMRFAPARVGGHPVRQLVEFPVQFHLSR